MPHGRRLQYVKKADGDTTDSPPTPIASVSIVITGTPMEAEATCHLMHRSLLQSGFSPTHRTKTELALLGNT